MGRRKTNKELCNEKLSVLLDDANQFNNYKYCFNP